MRVLSALSTRSSWDCSNAFIVKCSFDAREDEALGAGRRQGFNVQSHKVLCQSGTRLKSLRIRSKANFTISQSQETMSKKENRDKNDAGINIRMLYEKLM